MKKLFIFFACTIFPFYSFGQGPLSVNRYLDKVDSLRRNVLYDEALKTAEAALNFAKRNKDLKGEADTYVQMAWVKALQGNFEEAMDLNQRALQIRKNRLQDNVGTAKVYSNMCSIALDLGDQNEAYKYSELAIEFCPKDSFGLLTNIYNNQSNILEDLGSVEDAIAVNQKAINLFQLTHDTLTRVKTGYSLTKKLIDLSRFVEADSEINVIRTFLPPISSKDSLLIGWVQEITGMYFLHRPDCQIDSAIFYLQKAKEIFKKYPQAKADLGGVLFNLGQAYLTKNDLVQAKNCYNEALSASGGDDGNNSYNVSVQSMIAKVNAQMELNKTQKRENILLLVLLIAAITILISVYTNLKKEKLLLHKEKQNTRLIQQNFRLKHDVVKNGLFTIDNVLTSGISDFDDTSPGFELLKKVRKMVARILNQVGYSVQGDEEPETLKLFVADLEAQVKEIFPDAQNYSYLEGIDDSPMSKTLRDELTAIVTESFTNIRTHANCTRASMEFIVDDEGLTLNIEDNGDGFDLASVQQRGLQNIELRTAEINGISKVSSVKGKGTTINIRIPVFPERPE